MLDIIVIILWMSVGVISYIHLIRKKFDVTTSDIPVIFIAAVGGLVSVLVSLLVFWMTKDGKVLFKKYDD